MLYAGLMHSVECQLCVGSATMTVTVRVLQASLPTGYNNYYILDRFVYKALTDSIHSIITIWEFLGMNAGRLQ